ncbi:MAG: hypothetical protein FWH34_06380 [Desulfovibrionaceae bacterium]|nr:hypothetical protein [Desulfovibrionaceae bacterium]
MAYWVHMLAMLPMRCLSAVFAIMAMVAVLAGCVAQLYKIPVTTPFTAEEAKIALEPGNNTVKGSALVSPLLRRSGGKTVTCAGMPIHIAPVTTYSKARMTALYDDDNAGYNPALNGRRLDEPVNFWAESARETTCDAQGYFTFEKLKDGEYYVSSQIVWLEQTFPEGGVLMKKVSVQGGETKEIVLSGY